MGFSATLPSPTIQLICAPLRGFSLHLSKKDTLFEHLAHLFPKQLSFDGLLPQEAAGHGKLRLIVQVQQ
jgi:hypothetical protein